MNLKSSKYNIYCIYFCKTAATLFSEFFCFVILVLYIQQKTTQNDKFTFNVYLCYLLYAPLYVAGPIISFNAFASQVLGLKYFSLLNESHTIRHHYSKHHLAGAPDSSCDSIVSCTLGLISFPKVINTYYLLQEVPSKYCALTTL